MERVSAFRSFSIYPFVPISILNILRVRADPLSSSSFVAM